MVKLREREKRPMKKNTEPKTDLTCMETWGIIKDTTLNKRERIKTF